MKSETESFRNALVCCDNAVRSLALSDSDFKSRLKEACHKIYSVKPEHMPREDLITDLNSIRSHLTSHGPIQDENGKVVVGQIEASLNSLDSEVLHQLAQQIYSMLELMNEFRIQELESRVQELEAKL